MYNNIEKHFYETIFETNLDVSFPNIQTQYMKTNL